MSTFDTLPVILISAANNAIATKFISELIDNDVTSEYDTETSPGDRVWRLVNKYYRADVRVHTLLDGEPLLLAPLLVEAHIVHITEEESASESEGVEAARARVGGAGGAGAAGCWGGAHVRLVACDCAREPRALAAWGGTRGGAELVPLRARALGVPRVRDALHAHLWRNLRRVGLGAQGPGAQGPGAQGPGAQGPDADEGSDSDEWGSWQEAEGEEEDVQDADVERFAAALGAVGAARGAALGAARGAALGAARERAPDEERRARAESVLRAFCRVLGHDLDTF